MTGRHIACFTVYMRKCTIVLIPILVALAAACQPAPGVNAVAGDSITGLAAGAPWISSQPASQKCIQSGKTAGACVQWERNLVDNWQTSPGCIPIEFGNEPGDGVITQTEKDDVFKMVFAPDPATRVVIVLSWRLHPTPGVAAAVNEWRDVETTLHNARPGSVIVDLQDIYEAHPDWVADDGVHEKAQGALALDDAYSAACS